MHRWKLAFLLTGLFVAAITVRPHRLTLWQKTQSAEFAASARGQNAVPVAAAGQSAQRAADAAASKEHRGLSVRDPRPQTLRDIKKMNINTAAMKAATMRSWDGRSFIVMTFPSAQDQYVSGSFQGGVGWETAYVDRALMLWKSRGQGRGNLLDCGANVGSWTLPFAKAFVGTRSSVIAIEATPPIADHLRAGILANGADNVALYPYAVSSPNHGDRVTVALNPTNAGGSGLVSNMGSWGAHAQQFTVPVTTMDDILNGSPALANVFYGKFDIEGNEARMLSGAHRLFTKYPPCVIFMELNDELLMKTGSSKFMVEMQLARFGYDVARRIGSGTDFQYMQRDMASCVRRLT